MMELKNSYFFVTSVLEIFGVHEHHIICKLGTLMPLIDVLAWISVLGYEFYYISKILIKVKNKEIRDINSQNQ